MCRSCRAWMIRAVVDVVVVVRVVLCPLLGRSVWSDVGFVRATGGGVTPRRSWCALRARCGVGHGVGHRMLDTLPGTIQARSVRRALLGGGAALSDAADREKVGWPWPPVILLTLSSKAHPWQANGEVHHCLSAAAAGEAGTCGRHSVRSGQDPASASVRLLDRAHWTLSRPDRFSAVAVCSGGATGESG